MKTMTELNAGDIRRIVAQHLGIDESQITVSPRARVSFPGDLPEKQPQPQAAPAFTPEPQPEKPQPPKSRVERMFGKREEWGAAPQPQAEPEAEAQTVRPVKEFLIIKCRRCGATRSFFLKDYATATRCAGCGEEFVERVIRNPQEWENSKFFSFYADAAKLLIEARQSMEKQSIGASRSAAIKRIYKSAARGSRVNLRGVFLSGDRWAICDGNRFVRLNSKPESIPECEGGIDLERAIPADARTADSVALPSVVEVKAFMAEHPKNNRGIYRIMEALPDWWCNPEYLLDMLQALPGGTAHKPKNGFSALYYESPDGDALLLPCYPSKQ